MLATIGGLIHIYFLYSFCILRSVKTEDIIHVCNLKNQSKKLSFILFETCRCVFARFLENSLFHYFQSVNS